MIDALKGYISQLQGYKGRGKTKIQHFAERQKVIWLKGGEGLKEEENMKEGSSLAVRRRDMKVKEQACGLWRN